jgi:subtilisin family serine protease
MFRVDINVSRPQRRYGCRVAGFITSLLLPALTLLPAQAQDSKRSNTELLQDIAKAPVTERFGDVSFVTKNRNLEELGLELSRLYLTLYNSRRLSVKHVLSRDSESIEQVFRNERLFYGKTFGPELESLACDLNTHVCSRTRVPATPEKLSSLTQHVSGFLPSRGTWRLTPGISLVVPSVELTPDTEWFKVEKPQDRTLESFVVDDLGGCIKMDDRCRQLIAFYNPTLGNQIFDASYRGAIALPALTATLVTNIATAAEAPLSRPSTDVVEIRPEKTLTLQKTPDLKGADSYKVVDPAISTPTFSPLPNQSFGRDVVKQLHDNIIGGIKLNRFESAQPVPGARVFPNDFQRYREELAKLIGFRWTTLPYHEDFQNKVPIGVLDTRIDELHCAFDYDVHIFVNNSSPAPNADASGDCNIDVTGREDVDHGTHVVGIIGARYPKDGTYVMWGLNPYAKIVATEIDFAGINKEEIGRKLKKMVQDHLLKVVNFSFGYLLTAQNPDVTYTDVLERPIAGLEDSTLFVAAVGNAGVDKSLICDIRPACFDLPNVIAVAALDRDSENPSFLVNDSKAHSNYGRRVHIAAVGREVFSTLTNGKFGTMTGTSQAAPQVAAVASLLVSKYSFMKPIEIKNRLIYCSDLMRSLEGKLFGGRLNADCTLDGDDGRLQLRGSTSIQHGKFVLPRQQLLFADSDGSELPIPIQNARSIHFDPWNQTYTVFYTAKNRPDSQLLRASNLSFKNDEDRLTFQPKGASADQIKVSQILHYVSPIK